MNEPLTMKEAVGTNNQKPAKRRLPVRVDKLELDGIFEGWWFTARINPRMELFGRLMRGSYAGMVSALSELTVGEWNFVDEEGEPLPQPHVTRQNYERWLRGNKEDEMPLSPEDLIGRLTIDLIISMSQAVGGRVQNTEGN